jgi:hypothetical protein
MLAWLLAGAVVAACAAAAWSEHATWRRASPGRRAHALRRRKRRQLAAALLALIALLGAASFHLDFENPGQWAGWNGIQAMLLVWLVILATRDLRDSLEDHSRARREATREALDAVQQILASRPSEDDRLIPILRVPSPPEVSERDGEG